MSDPIGVDSWWKVNVFGQVLTPERCRQKMGVGARLQTPVLHEASVPPEAAPFLVTNARGGFVGTRRSSHGSARCGFSPCKLEEEPLAFNRMYDSLDVLSRAEGWSNRASSIKGGIDRLVSLGMKPSSVVVSESFLPVIFGEGYDREGLLRSASIRGYLGQVHGIRVLPSNLPEGRAIVFGPPAETGIYVRAGEYIGLLLQRVDRCMILVDTHGVAGEAR